jgi:HD domain
VAPLRGSELVTEAEPAFLLNHSIRSYAWAVELARHDNLTFDPEIPYVPALFHDIGLTPGFDIGGCFGVDGAIAAEQFSLEQRQTREGAQAIYDVVALHMTEYLSPESASEVLLAWDSTGVDVTGYRYGDVRSSLASAVVAAYPRLAFKEGFGRFFRDQARSKPTCRVAKRVAARSTSKRGWSPFDPRPPSPVCWLAWN